MKAKILIFAAMIAASSVLVSFSLPAKAAVDPLSLPPCDFTNGIPNGATYQYLLTIQQEQADYLNTPNPICNPRMGKGEVLLPLPQNANTYIAWPVPVILPSATPSPSVQPTVTPEVLAAQTPTLPDTGASTSDILFAAILGCAIGGALWVRRVLNRS